MAEKSIAELSKNFWMDLDNINSGLSEVSSNIVNALRYGGVIDEDLEKTINSILKEGFDGISSAIKKQEK
ncbi:hypothetical protein FE392_12255 [Xenorhabdus sp. 12]|uniref:Uncharacterized protein n=1 Tax=Xenorhabdus santafensis TaxID=2582833 RepID=A0ABU4SBB0_9GAMM|nr:hypothetical protein [Xenorhabdus sp. 12]MDX7988098.1 hypothetical protein [Xenorhabdus sp. 12]